LHSPHEDVVVRVKVNADLPKAAVQMLQGRGYEAVSVVEQGLGGAKDAPLWLAVQAEQRFLVTGDKGFGDIRSFPPGTHAGILLLRPDHAGIRPILQLLERTLAAYDLEALTGAVAVATPRGVRIRRPKSEGVEQDSGSSLGSS
jgi:predicted nuclease of predicted toxin-antitoxin system